MIEKQGRTWHVACDNCSFSDEVDEDEAPEFTDVVQAIKDMKWRIVKVNDGWDHLCPDCAYLGE